MIQHINAEELPDDISFHEIASISNSLTSELLAFSKSNASYNIVGMMNTRKANCVGYARMFNAIANYLIRENDLGDQIIAQHKIGKLSLWGIDLHSIINRPFFQDHDYNEIKDLHTGESLFVDPSLSDYLGIDFVREHK
ncbi:MAG: hypothetical protein GYB31_17040 [Bacteroidetes bacterium]|nr:hypothetical protein [Bacteroidota bacterium]